MKKQILEQLIPNATGIHFTEMPADSEILSVGYRGHPVGRIAIWFLTSGRVETKITRRFMICETGVAIDPDSVLKRLGTLVLDDGSYVLHVFEVDKFNWKKLSSAADHQE